MRSSLIGNEKALQRAQLYAEGKSFAPLLISGEKGLGQDILAMDIAYHILKSEKVEKHADFFALRPEKGLIGIEAVEEMLDRSCILAQNGAKRVLGIFGIGYMTKQAQNRLLKLLEDKSYQNVILMTYDGGTVLDTIISRSALIRMQRLAHEEITEYIRSQGEQRDEAVCRSVLRGCPYRYGEVKEHIQVLAQIYREQLYMKRKSDLFFILGEIKEKDKNSFYEKNKKILEYFLDMELSLFEELLLAGQGMNDKREEKMGNMCHIFSLRDVVRIMETILEHKRMIESTGAYTKNDFFDLLRCMCF